MASRNCLRVAYLLMLSLALASFIPSPALGFKFKCSGCRQMASSSHRASALASTPRVRVLPSSNTLLMSMTSNQPRDEFLYKCLISPLIALTPSVAHAFDGGVGGLGKTRPQTGVVFRDPEEAAAMTTQSKIGNVNYELLAPDGSPVFLSFFAPWPLSKSAAGIESRDISGGYESTFVQVAELPKGVSLDNVKPAIISQTVFGSTGKFGMYGSPTDVKIKKTEESATGAAIYQASFTTLTPAMRESERQAYISANVVGNGLFLLVTSTTAARFRKLDVLKQVADSFSAVPAPKSSLNRQK
ncbi:hypothetical protein ACHAWU_003896 [Discostella pseudostelligera]|uniref:Photosystem II reaction center PsbP family protein n=1 Tax=Discostella pseudostelligera TaxID=259834 RepID=A0ABD3MMI0_9STRA